MPRCPPASSRARESRSAVGLHLPAAAGVTIWLIMAAPGFSLGVAPCRRGLGQRVAFVSPTRCPFPTPAAHLWGGIQTRALWPAPTSGSAFFGLQSWNQVLLGRWNVLLDLLNHIFSSKARHREPLIHADTTD